MVSLTEGEQRKDRHAGQRTSQSAMADRFVALLLANEMNDKL
jgi:hypothetical protein